MTYQEMLDYFTHVDMLGSHLGLTRMEELLALLDSPQKRLKFIHVAGTNGKGSTSALLDACLRQAGLRVGLYTSPHLVRYNERFRINGEEVSDEALCAAAARVKAAADTMEDAPTQFELLTCVGFCCFEAAGCDIVVLEVGLGGRLDATNVIPAPEAAVITRIGLEHTELLGDTLEKIAAEKAGIVKAGGTVVLGDHAEPVRRTVEEICRQRGARLIQAEEPAPLTRSLEGQRFAWGRYPEVRLSLLGEHQLQNAATALAVLEVLRERGWPIPDQAVLEGMAHAVWPGRFECAGTHPAIIVDGGHNPQCAQAVAASLAAYFPGKKISFLMGVLADKDFRGIFDPIVPLAERIAAVTPDSPRALPAAELCRKLAGEYGFTAAAPYPDAAAALAALRESVGPEDVICVCGSLYMIGEVRTLLGLP